LTPILTGVLKVRIEYLRGGENFIFGGNEEMKKWLGILVATFILSSSFLGNAQAADGNIQTVKSYDEEPEPLPIQEIEPNNKYDEAMALPTGTVVNGSITEGDVDYFKFEIDRKSYFNLSGAAKGENDSIHLSIYDSSFNVMHDSGKPSFTEIHNERVLNKPGTYYIKLQDYNDNPKTEDYSIIVRITPSDIIRIAGADRYETAVNIAYASWLWADDIVLATGEDFPDALTAGPLASRLQAPLLLTRKNEIPASVLEFIRDYRPERVIIIGGTGVISQGVEDYLFDTLDLGMKRIAGKDRFETAVKIAEEVAPDYLKSSVFVVNGRNYPDALSAAPIAAYKSVPILLTETNTLPTVTVNELRKFNEAYAIGEKGVISDSVFKLLPPATRIGGKNRYETSVAVAQYFNGYNNDKVFLTTGEKFPDALAASVIASAHNQPIILTTPNMLQPSTKSYFQSNQVMWYTIIGGTGAVSTAVEQEIWALLNKSY
jgi:putative cell wall-binding protein